MVVWCRKRSIEREKNGMHEAKFLTCWTCAIANAAATCKRMHSRQCVEQTTRLREDMVKKIQHETTRSCKLPSKGGVVSAQCI